MTDEQLDELEQYVYEALEQIRAEASFYREKRVGDALEALGNSLDELCEFVGSEFPLPEDPPPGGLEYSGFE